MSNNRIYLKGLPWGTSVPQLYQLLEQHLVEKPVEVYIHRNDPMKKKCSAFVTFSGDASEMAAHLDGLVYNTYRLSCELAAPKKRKFLGCASLCFVQFCFCWLFVCGPTQCCFGIGT